MRHFVFRWAITTLAVMVAPALIGGIRYDTPGALIGASLLLGIFNAFVRPILLILSAPLILVTLGFFHSDYQRADAVLGAWNCERISRRRFRQRILGGHFDRFGQLAVKRIFSRKRRQSVHAYPSQSDAPQSGLIRDFALSPGS